VLTDILPKKGKCPARRADQREQHPNGGALAGAVGSQKAENLPLLDRQIQVGDRPAMPEAFAEIEGLQDDLIGFHHSDGKFKTAPAAEQERFVYAEPAKHAKCR